MKKIHIETVDGQLIKQAQQRLDILTKPQGSLGRLEDFARQLVGIAGKLIPPPLSKKAIFTFAGDHGVVDEGVSLFPKEVTIQMVYNILRGGAAINALGRCAGADQIVVDIGVDYDFIDEKNLLIRKVLKGTANMHKGPAMTRESAERCIDTGIALAIEYGEKGYKMFGTGEMGIGNTTPSSAVAAVIAGTSVRNVTGRGTGIDNESLEHKIKIIEESIAINKPDSSDPIDVLAKVGGTEIGGIAGLILGGASLKIPIVVDGFISTAGALIAYSLEPAVKDYMFFAHNSVERGHAVIMEAMGGKPILNLDMRLGEGTGAALAMSIIESALAMYGEMATFDEAGVSRETS